MGCGKCKKTKCSCGSSKQSGELSQLQAQLDELSSAVNAFVCGHPILMIQEAEDVASFDLTTGKGSDCWEGWAICDGKTHKNLKTKKSITTPNLIDRFVVMATGSYAVNDIGGEAAVQLTSDQNGTHNHGVTDPGHSHTLTDLGHSHGITDPGHNHAGNTAEHSHTFTTGNESAHNHPIPDFTVSVASGGDAFGTDGVVDSGTGAGSAHSHNGTTDIAAAALEIDSANTGVSVQDAFTGITQDSAETGLIVNESGLGEAHNNLPPYYALIFVQKI